MQSATQQKLNSSTTAGYIILFFFTASAAIVITQAYAATLRHAQGDTYAHTTLP
jgi:hypothetical protein